VPAETVLLATVSVSSVVVIGALLESYLHLKAYQAKRNQKKKIAKTTMSKNNKQSCVMVEGICNPIENCPQIKDIQTII